MKTQLFNENSHNEFQHHYIHIESKKLHYVTLGEGPAVLLIPGWPQTWYAWHKVMLKLAKQGYRAIAVDLPEQEIQLHWMEVTIRVASPKFYQYS